VDETSEVIQAFRRFSKELDAKHDKYERIVKLSRDVTIESKRIIFQIHSITRWKPFVN
jgi:predicted translin family RNA/ssDNA-binding protein